MATPCHTNRIQRGPCSSLSICSRQCLGTVCEWCSHTHVKSACMRSKLKVCAYICVCVKNLKTGSNAPPCKNEILSHYRDSRRKRKREREGEREKALIQSETSEESKFGHLRSIVCVCMCVCAWVRVSMREENWVQCVCVCVREREREKWAQIQLDASKGGKF